MDSLSRTRHLGLHEDNDPEKSGQEYGKSIFSMHENTVNDIGSNENINNKFEIDGIKYFLDEKELILDSKIQILTVLVLIPYHAYVI